MNYEILITHSYLFAISMQYIYLNGYIIKLPIFDGPILNYIEKYQKC